MDPLYGVIAALLLYCFYVQRNKDRQIDALLKEMALERGAWDRERTNLINANDSERASWDAERKELMAANDEERKLWAKERRDLNNRIQVPQAAPFMADEEPQPQHVPFEDDEAFAENEKELMANWP